MILHIGCGAWILNDILQINYLFMDVPIFSLSIFGNSEARPHFHKKEFIFNRYVVFITCLSRALFRDDLLPKGTKIIGYGRSPLTIEQLEERIRPYIRVWR